MAGWSAFRSLDFDAFGSTRFRQRRSMAPYFGARVRPMNAERSSLSYRLSNSWFHDIWGCSESCGKQRFNLVRKKRNVINKSVSFRQFSNERQEKMALSRKSFLYTSRLLLPVRGQHFHVYTRLYKRWCVIAHSSQLIVVRISPELVRMLRSFSDLLETLSPNCIWENMWLMVWWSSFLVYNTVALTVCL